MTTTDLNTKLREVKNTIPDTSSSATPAVFNTKIGQVKNKILDHANYTTAPEFDKLTGESFADRLKKN